MRARNTRILGKDALEALEKTLGTSHLPEMVYGSTLELTHESTGVRLHFNAEDALKEWLEEGLPPLKVAAAAVWEKGHKARFGDEMPLSLIHISEPTRPERISYAVFCLKKKKR